MRRDSKSDEEPMTIGETVSLTLIYEINDLLRLL